MNGLRSSRRKSQVKPTRDALPLPPEPSSRESRSRDLLSESGFIAEPRSTPAPTMRLSERRRLRRSRKMAEAGGGFPAAVPRDARRTIFISWRWFSATIVGVLIIVLLIFSQPAFRIHSILVGYAGTTHFLTPPEIFGRSGLTDLSVFQVDPAQVEQTLELDPEIASAQVDVSWPPNIIQITITERQPALIWEQSGQRVWVDVRGRVMDLRQDLPDLVRVVVEKPSKDVHLGKCTQQGMDAVLPRGSCIDQDTINGVLQFKALYPNVTEVVYDPIKGLGYHEGGGFVLWFGNGVDIPTKMAVFNAIFAQLATRGVQPIEINVANPDAPYYTTVK